MKKSGGGYMHEGMKNMSPSGDSGMRPPKGSVNDAATRDKVAPTPKTLGPSGRVRPIPPVVLTLIHEFEGNKGTFEPTRVQDPAGHWEIGYSHKLTGPDDPIWDETLDQDQADALAMQDLTTAATAVCDALGDGVMRLTDNQYAALIDFTYNEGGGAFAGSTLCTMVKGGYWAAAAAQFGRWDIAGGQVLEGLERRRLAEKDLFQA